MVWENELVFSTRVTICFILRGRLVHWLFILLIRIKSLISIVVFSELTKQLF